MRSYIFTDSERRRLRRWLETGEEDGTTRQIFVDVRRDLDRITNDVHLLTEVARRLRAEGRMAGRVRLPSRLDSLSRRVVSASTRLGRGRITSAVLRTS